MTTTAAHAGFIADICEHPEDDTPRLIYADWLEDHGEPERAEFIRVQVELETNGLRHAECSRNAFHEVTCVGDERAICERSIYLKHREKTLRDNVGYSYSCRNENLWAGEGIVRLKDHGANWKFSRGFIAEVHAPLVVLEQHLPALVREHPIERVRATDKEPRHYNGLTESYVWWRHLVVSHPQSRLPQNVWNAAREDGNPPGAYLDNGKRFLAADAAHAALSEAMLRLAKGVNFALES